MKKINLLPTFSITQQKEIAQWHRYTMIALAIVFAGAILFQLFYVVRSHALKKDSALLRKKMQPYDPFIKALGQTKEDINRLQKQIIELKKIAQQAASRINFVSKIVTDTPSMRSLVLNNDDVEVTLMFQSNNAGERELMALRSYQPLSGLTIASVQGAKKGQMSAILRGKIA